MHVIGTAGHVDHGKSALVHALTGIDPDRLAEEKERGLTIDLGFAWMTLPSGREVSIVDVPGHERFIKNMLAGAGGVDLALLVVAADEGPMPQTREHLAILERLDIPAGIVVITKSDLVEAEYLDLVHAELEEELAGSMLAGAPMLSVSVRTGDGLAALATAIDTALDRVPEKRDMQRPRVPIDRAFTVQGFGTVVTGTLVDGTLRVGDEVELQPGRTRARVRGLQRHKTKVESLEPGTRAAINLGGIAVEDVHRGMVVALPGTLPVARAVDVRLTAAATAGHSLSHDAVITFLSGTAETQARVRLLDSDELQPGASCWAQVVFESEVAVLAGDRCILRTPNETVAGGPILAVNPRRHRRFHAATIETLERMIEDSPESRLVTRLAGGPATHAEVAALLGASAAEADTRLAPLIDAGHVHRSGDRIFSADWLASLAARLEAATATYLRDHPLRSWVPREHLRSQLGLDADNFDAVVRNSLASGAVEGGEGAGLRPSGYRVELDARQLQEVDGFLARLAAEPYSPPTTDLPSVDLLAYLEESGEVVRSRAGVVYGAAAFEEMRRWTLDQIAAGGEVSLAQVRDRFGTSRKYAQAFLEELDDRKVTRRVGDARVAR